LPPQLPAFEPGAQAVAPRYTQARLFLVEDNDGVRIATELFLKLEGHETLSARTVAEAEVLLERLAPATC
jgi:DNA-binding NtrC family response regulator